MSKKESLTLLRVENVAPGPKRFHLLDSKIPGLRLQITPAGTKTWQVYCRVKDATAPVRITIGKYPSIGLETARKKATQIVADLTLHGREAAEQMTGFRREATFEELFESWFKDQRIRGRRDMVNVRSRYTNHIAPTLGTKRVSELTPAVMQRWFIALPKRKSQRGQGTISTTTANRLLEIVSAVFAAKVQSNPAASIKAFPEQSRERYLTGAEMARLFEALDAPETSKDLRDIVFLALTTGLRKGNILSLSWHDVDFESSLIVIPAVKSKNARSMGIPLVQEAVEILARRKAAASSVFVFPATSSTGHIVDIKRGFAALLGRADIKDFVFHDLRRTLGSWQALTGSSDLLIGKSLGHSSTQSTRVYARLRDSNPIRDSMSRGVAAMREAAATKKVLKIAGGGD
jgi:integrase